MIKIQNLVKKIGDKIILRNLNLEVKAGETIAVLGPNGAGKSTLLKVVATLIKPTSGEVIIHGYDLKKDVNKIRENIGYLPHASLLYEHFSPLENLKFFGSLYSVKNLEERSKELIKQVGLGFFMNEPVKGFSRGMIQRVAIARAMVHQPELLLLDEPHTGLDQKAIGILNDVVQAYKENGSTTLIVTHDLKQAALICDRIIIIQNGKVSDDFQVEERSESWLLNKYNERVGGEV
ncbi:MAG: heme exporter protein CcmA [Bacillales bacterium]|nr:heme exporter protein CcmA [Bacillales bacterium]